MSNVSGRPGRVFSDDQVEVAAVPVDEKAVREWVVERHLARRGFSPAWAGRAMSISASQSPSSSWPKG